MSRETEVATGYPIDGDEKPKKEMSACGDHRKPRCAECKFYGDIVDNSRYGEIGDCRRKPPKVVKHSTLAEYPVVKQDGWCGKFNENDASWGCRTDDAISKW